MPTTPPGGRASETWTANVEATEPGRFNRGSALLAGIALVCAVATVAFGIWMASYAQHFQR